MGRGRGVYEKGARISPAPPTITLLALARSTIEAGSSHTAMKYSSLPYRAVRRIDLPLVGQLPHPDRHSGISP